MSDAARREARGFRPFSRTELDGSLVARFARIVREKPQRIAIKSRRQTRSYGELDAHSNRIARALRRRLPGPPEPVGLHFARQSCEAIAAILGVLKSGHLYVPLDRSQAGPRLAATLAEAGARVVLTDRETPPLELECATLLEVDDLREPDDALAVRISPEAPAYIFYTSGSTGRPKGVVDCHRNVLHNVMRYTNALQIGSQDRLTLLQSLHFSGSVSSLFCALLNGATVCPFDVAQEGLVGLGAWLHEERITVYHSVPSIFRSWVGRGVPPSSLRVIRLEGDLANKRDVELFREHLPGSCVLAHGLGATETGLSCQLRIDAGSTFAGVLPVGYPLDDMEVVVLDEQGHALPAGMCGEIAVRSRYLALGYWRNPELTRRAFGSVDPLSLRTYRSGDVGRLRADGCVEYLGRKDAVERVHGLRVEPSDIEAALLDLSDVREAAVATHRDEHGEAQLVAYLVPHPGQAVPPARSVRQSLLAQLPVHMVPKHIVALERLPLNAHGKVDRRALPAPLPSEAAQASLGAALSLEEQLRALWSQVLGVAYPAIDDDFFELGGDSLAGVRMLAAVARQTGLELPPHTLLRARSIARLAALLRGDNHEPALATDTVLFFPSTPGTELAFAHLARDSALVCLETDWRTLPGEPSVAQIAAAYLDEVRRRQPHGPYRLGGFCFGGLIAFELARLLLERGEAVSEVALFAVRPSEMRPLIASTLLNRERLFSRWERWHDRCREFGRHLGPRQRLRELMHAILPRRSDPSAETLDERGHRMRRSATRSFHGRPLAARVAFFVAHGERWIFGEHPAPHLVRLSTAEVAVHSIPGARHTFFRRPHAPTIVALLRAEREDASPPVLRHSPAAARALPLPSGT